MHKPLRLSILAAALAASALLVMSSVGSATTTFNGNTAPSGAHYKNRSVEPVCTQSTVPTTGAVTVSCTGTQIGGVGNTNADLSLDVSATANFVCHNPGNDNIVEPHSGTASESNDVVLTPSKNGTLVVPQQSVTISPQEAGAQFSCPNPNWREEFTGFSDLSFTYSLTFVGFGAPAILIQG